MFACFGSKCAVVVSTLLPIDWFKSKGPPVGPLLLLLLLGSILFAFTSFVPSSMNAESYVDGGAGGGRGERWVPVGLALLNYILS